MTPVIIGVFSGLLIVAVVAMFRRSDLAAIYSLILSGIGFIYVGFTWSVTEDLIINSVQALFFLFVALYGLRKGLHFLAFGYFLHGIWDLLYNYFESSHLVPSNYDWFCMTLDFTIAVYLLLLKSRTAIVRNRDKNEIVNR
ncbi:MAG: hypothetical protein H7Y42_11750 [Chitinophagaceae bacterium]|nr:hypothetical protein [Chitinophagaceae bacterium]